MQQEESKNLIDRFVKPLFVKTINYSSDIKPATTTPNYTKPLSSYPLQGRDVDFTDSDLDELSLILFGEVSNRPEEKQDLERRVIANTAINRLGEYRKAGRNMSLTDVLRQPNQYQAYLPSGIKGKDGSITESQYMKAKKGTLDEVSKRKYENIKTFTQSLKSGKFDDNTEGAFYYIHNPDGSIKYDNTRNLI
jgi:hypothetical protein